MAARAARLAIVAGLVVGPHEPHIGVVEARLVEVEDRDGDAQPGAGTAVRLLEVGAAGFFEPLDAAGGIGQADFGELRVDGAPAALRSEEHTSELQSLMRISYAVFCLH